MKERFLELKEGLRQLQTKNQLQEIKRGDILMIDLGEGRGSIQKNARPCVVCQNNIGNKFSPTIIVAPLTTRIGKKKLPTHVPIGRNTGIIQDSEALLEQITTVSKEQVMFKVGEVDEDIQKKLNIAMMISLGMFDNRKGMLTI